MGREKKVFNKDGTFQVRFRALYSRSNKTQKELAGDLGVSRPTVAGWLDGKNIPDILALEKIARLFNVSADYLLGLSDTESPDVSVRAAAEYTGLTEDAVKRLNNGLFDPVHNCGRVYEQEKKRYLRAASALIQSDDFRKTIESLTDVARVAYIEKIIKLLLERYFEPASPVANSKFCYTSNEEREFVLANLSHVLKMLGTKADKNASKKVPEMSDQEVTVRVYGTLTRVERANELFQFHASKAFTGYIDQVVRRSRKQAENRFKEKH